MKQSVAKQVHDAKYNTKSQETIPSGLDTQDLVVNTCSSAQSREIRNRNLTSMGRRYYG
jgi:ribosomal protein L22